MRRFLPFICLEPVLRMDGRAGNELLQVLAQNRDLEWPRPAPREVNSPRARGRPGSRCWNDPR